LPEGTTVFASGPPEAPERAHGAADAIDSGGNECVEGVHPTARFETPAGPEGPLHYAEKKRGEVVHRICALIDYVDGDAAARVGAAVEKVRREVGEEGVPGALKDAIVAFLGDAAVAGWFERRPGRTIMLEQELADGRGRLFRADRVVMDADRTTVMEFKTGRDEDYEGHVAQMRNYLRLTGEIYKDKPVEGIIAYVDARKSRRIRV
jgi:hypothetical protein